MCLKETEEKLEREASEKEYRKSGEKNIKDKGIFFARICLKTFF